MASDIWLRTILIVKKEIRCRQIGYSFWLTARVLLCAPSHRQDSTYHGLCYTSRGALAGTRNSSMVHPMTPATNQCSFSDTHIHVISCNGSSDQSFMVDPLSYFLFQPVLHEWCNKGCGMYDLVCGMMHIKDPLLLIGKSNSCRGNRKFSLSLSEYCFTICLMPINHK